MYVSVVGMRKGCAESFGRVHARSFADAIALVFQNRAMYPRVIRENDNRWKVEVSSITNRIHYVVVHCEKLEEPVQSQDVV